MKNSAKEAHRNHKQTNIAQEKDQTTRNLDKKKKEPEKRASLKIKKHNDCLSERHMRKTKLNI